MAITTYSAYDLSIASEIAMSGVERSSTAATATCRVGAPPSPDVKWEKTPYGRRAISDTGVWLTVDDVATYFIRNGNEMIVSPSSNASADDLENYLIEYALGTLLQQRGCLVLHASSVATANGAMVLMGQSGSGKSTLAAVLAAAGYTLLADDIVVIRNTLPLTVLPGPQRLKLHHELAAMLSINTVPATAACTVTGKRVYTHVTSRPASATPLAQLYVYTNDTAPLTPMKGADSVLALTTHSYCLHLMTPHERQRHLTQCSRLAQARTVVALPPPVDFAEFERLASIIDTRYHNTVSTSH